jgi:phytoene synthase
MSKIEEDIFNKGSTTYYWSSKFFPKNVREDVFKLYSFVRVVDDYVDVVPSNVKEFKSVKNIYLKSIDSDNFEVIVSKNDDINTRVVKNIIYVSRKYNFEKSWVMAFLDSMEMDLNQRKYKKLDEVLEYIYGSAEVIGLMMAKIMALPEKSLRYAQMQGRAMQWINFLRDINEDIELGRVYIPEEDLMKFGFAVLDKKSIISDQAAFCDLVKYELERYETWQKEAYDGYVYIPKRLRLPLQTATDMYNWTAKKNRTRPDDCHESQN